MSSTIMTPSNKLTTFENWITEFIVHLLKYTKQWLSCMRADSILRTLTHWQKLSAGLCNYKVPKHLIQCCKNISPTWYLFGPTNCSHKFSVGEVRQCSHQLVVVIRQRGIWHCIDFFRFYTQQCYQHFVFWKKRERNVIIDSTLWAVLFILIHPKWYA